MFAPVATRRVTASMRDERAVPTPAGNGMVHRAGCMIDGDVRMITCRGLLVRQQITIIVLLLKTSHHRH